MIHLTLVTAALLTFVSTVDAQRPEGGRPQPPAVPLSVEAKLDIAYAGTDNVRQRLDLFLPKDRESGKKLPVHVYVHGGAWRAGHKEQGPGQVMRFVAEGRCARVSVGYRLSQGVAMLGTSAGVAEMDGKLGPNTDKDTKVASVFAGRRPCPLLRYLRSL